MHTDSRKFPGTNGNWIPRMANTILAHRLKPLHLNPLRAVERKWRDHRRHYHHKTCSWRFLRRDECWEAGRGFTLVYGEVGGVEREWESKRGEGGDGGAGELGFIGFARWGLCPKHYEPRLTGVIIGPAAAAYLQALTSFDLRLLTFGKSAFVPIEGFNLHVARGGYTGEDGFEVWFPPSPPGSPAHVTDRDPDLHSTIPNGWSRKTSLKNTGTVDRTWSAR